MKIHKFSALRANYFPFSSFSANFLLISQFIIILLLSLFPLFFLKSLEYLAYFRGLQTFLGTGPPKSWTWLCMEISINFVHIIFLKPHLGSTLAIFDNKLMLKKADHKLHHSRNTDKYVFWLFPGSALTAILLPSSALALASAGLCWFYTQLIRPATHPATQPPSHPATRNSTFWSESGFPVKSKVVRLNV